MTLDPDYFWLQVRMEGDVTVARLTLDDLWQEEKIEALGAELLNLADDLEPPRLVLDLGGITGMGSRMIAQLATLYRQVSHAGGRVVLCAVRPDVAEVLDLCRMTTLLPMYPDVAAAARSFEDVTL